MLKSRPRISSPNFARASISDGTAVELTLARAANHVLLYSAIAINFTIGTDTTDGSVPSELGFHPGRGFKLISLDTEFDTIFAIRVNGGETGLVAVEETDLPEGVFPGDFFATVVDIDVPSTYEGQTSIVTLGRVTTGRVMPEVTSEASSATPTPNADTTDVYILTALAANATFGAPTGTPVDGQELRIRIKDNSTVRTLAWNAIYRAGDIALPTTTVDDKTMYLTFVYNAADTKWDLVEYVDNV